VTLLFEKSPITLDAVAGCSILLWRPRCHVSYIWRWQDAQACAPTNTGDEEADG
jgi:hypothetical protein